MATAVAKHGPLRFGDFSLELATAELRKLGVTIKLQYQPARILALLVVRAGETVTREEIVHHIWGSATHVDFEQGLNAAIRQIRAALKDDPVHPTYIETVPRRGYRFIAPVEANGGGSEAQNASLVTVAPPAAPAAVRSRTLLIVPGSILILLALFAIWWFNPVPAPRVVRIDQVTTSARLDTPFRPVSDATHVYYDERDGDHWNLRRAPMDGGEAEHVEVPGKSGAVLDVSSDGRRLLLGTFERRDAEKQLWTMPADGGAAKRLDDAMAGDAVFSPDGRSVGYLRGSQLWVMDVDGRHSHKLAELPGPPFSLAWSPDGSRFRFSLWANNRTAIWEVAVDGSNLHQVDLGANTDAVCCGAWTRDGKYFIYNAQRGSTWNVWALREHHNGWRRSPRGPFQLTSGPGSPIAGTPSFDDSRIFFYSGAWRQEYMKFAVATHHLSPVVPNARVAYSHDGRSIAYVASDGDLYRSRISGGDRILLVPRNTYPTFPRWSPDGKWILFGGLESGKLAMSYVIPADGGRPEPVLRDNSGTADADWSGDGRHIVITRMVGISRAATREVDIVDFATHGFEKIPGSEGLAMTRWSPDGRFISATRVDQKELMLWDVDKHEWHSIARGTAFGISAWSSDSRFLYFQDLLGKGEPLYRFDVRNHRTELVANFSDALEAGADRCAFDGLSIDGSPVIAITRGNYDLFSARVSLP